jgi:hypothetical protein
MARRANRSTVAADRAASAIAARIEVLALASVARGLTATERAELRAWRHTLAKLLPRADATALPEAIGFYVESDGDDSHGCDVEYDTGHDRPGTRRT